MASKEDLKALAFQEIDARADEIVGIAQTILKHPEPGFRETKTSRLVGNKFADLGIPARSGLAITGVKGELVGGTEGPTLAILGELDSLIVQEHPHSDVETGAAHACGHHCQIAMLIGATMGLMSSQVLSELSGRLVLMAVPAEEYIEIEYRDSLRREGKIEFLGGKPEMIRLGELDDVNLAMMLHTTSQKKRLTVQTTGGPVQVRGAVESDVCLSDRRDVAHYADVEQFLADPGGSKTETVPERRPILPIISQRCVHRLRSLDRSADAGDLRDIPAAVEDPALV